MTSSIRTTLRWCSHTRDIGDREETTVVRERPAHGQVYWACPIPVLFYEPISRSTAAPRNHVPRTLRVYKSQILWTPAEQEVMVFIPSKESSIEWIGACERTLALSVSSDSKITRDAASTQPYVLQMESRIVVRSCRIQAKELQISWQWIRAVAIASSYWRRSNSLASTWRVQVAARPRLIRTTGIATRVGIEGINHGKVPSNGIAVVALLLLDGTGRLQTLVSTHKKLILVPL